MAARIPAVWGIDLGQCALKAIRLELKEGEVVATAFEYIEHPKILSQPDADPDELAREALAQFLSRNKIKGDLVAISVPGQSGLARFVKLPPVDEKKIADIVKFEAKQQIPFPLDEVVWDFQRLSTGEIIDGLALETEIGLFAMKRDMVNRAIRQFKEVGVEVHLVQMAPLALCNFIAYDLLGKGAEPNPEAGEETMDCVVALEIGTDNSNLVITNGGKIIWQRPIPIGGNHFTRALTKELKLTFAKAEHLKKNAAKSPDLKKILSSLKQVLNDFVGEVQRSLGYFTNTHRNAEIQYMVGLGNAFRLPGLQKFLQEKLQLEVRKCQRLERTTGETVTTAPTFAENIMSFGVAYGLALQGLKKAKLQTNLLPYEVRLERVIRGKKPWAVAAAASLLIGMSILALARGMERGAVKNPEVDKAVADAKSVNGQVSQYKTEYDGKEKAVREAADNIVRIRSGVTERPNWQLLHQYVNLSTPQPDGKRLPEIANNGLARPRDKFWDKDAVEAFKKFEERKYGKQKEVPPEILAKTERFVKRNLIQINIVGINTLYSDDFIPYFLEIVGDEKDSNILFGMKDEEKTKLAALASKPDDAEAQKSLPKDGWLVEIRGYTYHRANKTFVKETIMANLMNPDYLKAERNKQDLEDLKKRIESNVSFLYMYKNDVDPAPEPGKFSVISKSYLRALVKGKQAVVDNKGGGGVINPMNPMGGGGGGRPEGPGGLGGDDKKKPARDTWRPIGEIAASIFGEGGGIGPGFPGPGGREPPPKVPFAPPGKMMPPMPGGEFKGDPKAPAGKEVVPRTEFVILFIWREPVVSAKSEKKD